VTKDAACGVKAKWRFAKSIGVRMEDSGAKTTCRVPKISSIDHTAAKKKMLSTVGFEPTPG
jgi:hypothetical protein